MKRRQGPSAEQVVPVLRQIKAQTALGRNSALACKEADIYDLIYKDGCLRQDMLYSLKETQIVIGIW